MKKPRKTKRSRVRASSRRDAATRASRRIARHFEDAYAKGGLRGVVRALDAVVDEIEKRARPLVVGGEDRRVVSESDLRVH